jgi:hypothetical protein
LLVSVRLNTRVLGNQLKKWPQPGSIGLRRIHFCNREETAARFSASYPSIITQL